MNRNTRPWCSGSVWSAVSLKRLSCVHATFGIASSCIALWKYPMTIWMKCSQITIDLKQNAVSYAQCGALDHFWKWNRENRLILNHFSIQIIPFCAVWLTSQHYNPGGLVHEALWKLASYCHFDRATFFHKPVSTFSTSGQHLCCSQNPPTRFQDGISFHWIILNHSNVFKKKHPDPSVSINSKFLVCRRCKMKKALLIFFKNDWWIPVFLSDPMILMASIGKALEFIVEIVKAPNKMNTLDVLTVSSRIDGIFDSDLKNRWSG